MKNPTAYHQIPGKGGMNPQSLALRRAYLDQLVKGINLNYESKGLKLEQIQNNIENFIGSTEIPLGLVGPLLFENEGNKEWVHTAIGTTEGALVASMNRGAKAVSESGGFKAHILHQKMLRTPMFTFTSMTEALAFEKWVKNHFEELKEVCAGHSNHAELQEIRSVVLGKIAHLKFIFTTSDAAGQNMTTACTWQACLHIEKAIAAEGKIEILNFVIDGNGASDKKVSFYSMQNGRGIHVVSEAVITHEALTKTLRTTADDMFRAFNHSMAISRMDGMIGYNINVANTIAGIFAATGQDLACIHESSVAILQMEPCDEGLYVSLSLPSLVIGTVGGGTHLPIPAQNLELMGCKGAGGAFRLAQLIAGFALSLELSTHAAIVSGQFVRAHQKLGRNKPVNWLVKADLNPEFLNENVALESAVEEMTWQDDFQDENGILTELSQKVSKKLIGLYPLDLKLQNGKKLNTIVKSKALGAELSKGLHYMASNINADLADSFEKHMAKLEYQDSHQRELQVYEALQEQGVNNIPKLHGTISIPKREVFMLVMERLNPDNLRLFNAENQTEEWTPERQLKVIESISKVHQKFSDTMPEQLNLLKPKMIVEAKELFQQFINVNRNDYDHWNLDSNFQLMQKYLAEISRNGVHFNAKTTLIHNDFNPRNIAVTDQEEVIVYDWELAMEGIPQRDIFEFLAFTLPVKANTAHIDLLIDFHFAQVSAFNEESYSKLKYLKDLLLSAKMFVLNRLNFYLSGSTLVSYPFTERVFQVSFQLIAHIEQSIKELK